MHPEVVQIGPGTCPICGMALERKVIQPEKTENPELIDMQRRFWIELALATPVVLWGGWPFFVRAWQSLVTRNLNMFTLIGMSAGAAYFYSLFAVFFIPAPM